MECREVRERVSVHMDGELDEASSIRLIRHMERCMECRGLLGELRQVDDWVRGLPILEASPGFSRELAVRVGEWDAFSGERSPNRSILGTLLELLGYLSELMERHKGPGTHLLDEFDDFPPLSLGWTYFRMLGHGGGG
ncbi:MAG: zf-HC2 domain-containing protein [Syntrophobacteraceae bacterium]|jgi:hypothetical protein|nr:zf-HC2 domain-containing protein [Syntrophobacteraceae bacterium]